MSSMAAHHVTIAKASFAASLLRPDVVKVSRDDIPNFHSAFEATLLHCSRHNIQTCKDWLLQNVLVSDARTSAFGKYLTTISRHLALPADAVVKTSLARQRLHILYLVNDLLHHSKYHTSDAELLNRVAGSLQPILHDILQAAASEEKRKVSRRLEALLEIWHQAHYFDEDVLSGLKNALDGVRPQNASDSQEHARSPGQAKEAPYILPATHGDPSLPFYDLPAGNLMPHIIPNSSQPIRPDDIHALRFSSGPADESLVNALKDFLTDVQGVDDKISKLDKEGVSIQLDEMGQISYHDEAGDLIGDTYYGWSRSFCEKMKRRGRSDIEDSSQKDSSTNSSRSRSRSRGRISSKRRRYSASNDSRARTPRSYSRSPSRPRYGGSKIDPSATGDRSRSRSGVRSRARETDTTGFNPPPPCVTPTPFLNVTTHPPAPPGMGLPFPPPPPFQHGSVPLPPPRPPNWIGPWPPAPPLPPSYPPGNPAFHHLQFPPPPPPNLPAPPPPPAGWPLPPGQAYRGGTGFYPGSR